MFKMGEGKNIGTYMVDDPALPGVVFPVDISDPTKRIQAYLESWKKGSEEVCFLLRAVSFILSSFSTGTIKLMPNLGIR